MQTSSGIGSGISATIGVAALFMRPSILTILRINPTNYGSKYYVRAINISALGTATLALVKSTAHGITFIQLYSAHIMISVNANTLVPNETRNVVLMVKKYYIKMRSGPCPSASAIELTI